MKAPPKSSQISTSPVVNRRNERLGTDTTFQVNRQPGNNPESHELSGQVLLNAVPVNVKYYFTFPSTLHGSCCDRVAENPVLCSDNRVVRF
jgi:hypothetical protein